MVHIIVLLGFGDSEAGELLKKIPEIQDIFTIVSKIGEGRKTIFPNLKLVDSSSFSNQLDNQP